MRQAGIATCTLTNKEAQIDADRRFASIRVFLF
jgi:hypothetical protein